VTPAVQHEVLQEHLVTFQTFLLWYINFIFSLSFPKRMYEFSVKILYK
jgi:hypothetical protein